MDSTVNPYFSAGSNIASTIVGAAYDAYQQNRNREWNEQMMDKQNEFSLNMWNMTNEYNKPANQVARMHEAGLNPLYYGLDGSSANSFESAQALGYERAKAPNIDNPVESYQKAAALNAQIDNLKADTRKKLADAEGQEISNLNAQDLIDLDKQERDARITNLFAQANEADANAALAGQKTTLTEVETRYKETLNAIAQIESKYKEPLMEAVVNKTNAETHWLEYRQELEDARLALDNVNSEAQRTLAYKRVDYLEEQVKIAGEDARVAGEMVDAKLKEAKGDATYAKNKTALGYINETLKGVATVIATVKLSGGANGKAASAVSMVNKYFRGGQSPRKGR